MQLVELDSITEIQKLGSIRKLYTNEDMLRVRVRNLDYTTEEHVKECQTFIREYEQYSKDEVDIDKFSSFLKERIDNNIYAAYVDDCFTIFLNKELKHSSGMLKQLQIDSFSNDLEELKQYAQKKGVLAVESFNRIASRLFNYIKDLKFSIEKQGDYYIFDLPINIDIHFIDGFDKIKKVDGVYRFNGLLQNILTEKQLQILYKEDCINIGFNIRSESIVGYAVKKLYINPVNKSYEFGYVL